jgi:phosphonate transport system substrate-binding protein
MLFSHSNSASSSPQSSSPTSSARRIVAIGAVAFTAAALLGSLAGTAASAASKAKAKPAPAKLAPAPATTAAPAPVAPATTSPAKPARTLRIGAIPDVTPERLVEINGTAAKYLAKKLNVKVEYVPVADYPSAVSLFRTGDLDLVWFGGLTGVQARLQTPGAKVLAQRDVDDDFHSVFIVNTSVQTLPVIDSVGRLAALKGFRFTFGSESSTSGRTMPEYFLDAAGLDSSRDFAGAPGYSGSHDRTIDLVQAGTFEAGALNEQVWARRVAAGTVDLTKVKMVFRTPGYKDYHWIAGPKTDERFGNGFSDSIKEAFLTADADVDGAKVLSLLGSKKFIPTNANNYKEIEKIGRTLGLIR